MRYLKRFNENVDIDYIEDLFSELLTDIGYNLTFHETRVGAMIQISLNYPKEAYWGNNLRSIYNNRRIIGLFDKRGVYSVQNDKVGPIYSHDKNKAPDTEKLVDMLGYSLYRLTNSTEWICGYYILSGNNITIYLGDFYINQLE